MRYAENPKRQRVLMQALRATTLPEIERAAHDLHQWIDAHPDDVGIVDAFEQLDLMRRAVEEIAKPTQELVAVE